MRLLTLLAGAFSAFTGYQLAIHIQLQHHTCTRPPPRRNCSISVVAPAEYTCVQPNSDPLYDFAKVSSSLLPSTVFSHAAHPAPYAKADFVLMNGLLTQDIAHCTSIYRTLTGSRPNQPNKCIAIASIAPQHANPYHMQHRYGMSARKTDQFANDFSQNKSRAESLQYLPSLLTSLDEVKKRFFSKVGSPLREDGSRRSIIVLLANDGVFSLLRNFFCSLQSYDITTETIVVFVGKASHVPLIEALGAVAIYAPEAGSMPPNVAGNYGDAIFARMMWLKVTSVYLAATAGFDVLFQDVDLVWRRNPMEYMSQFAEDILFMDDGARSPRFAPFYTNSGFYYLKYNERNLYLMHRLLYSISEILHVKSHQSVLIRYMAEAQEIAGMSIRVLDPFLFPSGKLYHHNKTYIASIKSGDFVPFVFHMCWTANTADKVNMN